MDLFDRHLPPKVAKKPFLILGRCLSLKPSADCIIVMSAGVDEKILFIGVGQIRMHRMVLSKSKHEDLHPGKSEMVHDLSDIRRNHTEIFRNNRKVGKIFIQGIQKIFRRSLHPPPVDRCLLACGDFPVGEEAPEMVNSQDIKKLKVMVDPFSPPPVATFFENTPTINRVTPQLPCLTEIVRRNTRDKGRSFFRVELEQVGICPDVCTIKAYVDREIPKQVYPFLMTIVSERVPLLEEEILPELFSFELGVTFFLDRP